MILHLFTQLTFQNHQFSSGCVCSPFVLNLELSHPPKLIYCQLEYTYIPILKLLINVTSLLDYLNQNYLKAT